MDKFIGEHLWIGNLGHFFAITSFVAALVATYAYYKSTTSKLEQDQNQWKKLARTACYVELFTVIGIIISLYYILYNHLYEYKFAYKHSDNSLPIKYLFSCFWEGQEGSFLVWIFWHSVLSLFVMHSAKKWEAPVMAVIQFVQIFLCAFLLGIYFGDFHFGSSPFVLLRNSDMGIGPIFAQTNYLQLIKDGNGLNRTLQDPWMVIHPPTLFFGYASCTIPMAFAVAALWKKDYTGWIKPSLPWTLLAASVLGVGILMGAKWAYQSLSFGGYWAWDPVENASLVPWLILIAGMHTKLVYKHTGYSLKATFTFIILTFIFVIYSTALTRTGILGETSVHAFTGGGLKEQIWLLLAFVSIPPLFLLIKNYKYIPTIKREEAFWSREFWMFIGALVFFLSAMFIIFATSLPVFNKLFNQKYALPEDTQSLYNKVHIPIVIIIAIGIALTQYLKYKNTKPDYLLKKIAIPFAIAIVISLLFLFTTDGIVYSKQGIVFKYLITLALIASIFTTIANAAYIAQLLKKKWMLWGGSLAHIGFGLLLVGILISSSNQKILSINKPMMNIFGADSKENPGENLNILKGIPDTMSNYRVLYQKDELDKTSKKDRKQYYTINFTDIKTNENFVLKPSAYLNIMSGDKEGIQPNPDFKSYWNKDIFLYITSLLDPQKRDEAPKFIQKNVKIGDTSFLSTCYYVVKNSIVTNAPNAKNANAPVGFKVEVEVVSNTGKHYLVYPAYLFKDNDAQSIVDSIPAEKLFFRIDGIGEGNTLKFSVKDENKLTDYITIKVLEFPQIKLMWIGICIMSIGFMLSMVKRIQQLKQKD
jgi:cytochrome c-type biogenesis protein CcmF